MTSCSIAMLAAKSNLHIVLPSTTNAGEVYDQTVALTQSWNFTNKRFATCQFNERHAFYLPA